MSNPCADIQGVRSVDFLYAQELEIEAVIEESEPLLNRLGQFICAETYGAKNNFTIQGKGALPDGLLAGASVEIVGLETGLTFVRTTREEQRAGQYCDWTVSGTNYPHAATPV